MGDADSVFAVACRILMTQEELLLVTENIEEFLILDSLSLSSPLARVREAHLVASSKHGE